MRFAAAAFLSLALVLGAVVALSGNLLSSEESGHAESQHVDRVFGYWLHWDVGWYGRISHEGYPDREVENYDRGDESAAAFFPGYPMAIRAVSPVIDTPLSELVVTFIAGLMATCLFAVWCTRKQPGRATWWAVGALLLYPYAYYLVGAPYSDAVFLAAAVGAFLLAEDDRPFLAGIVGAIASATRPVGIGVVIGLILVVVQRRRRGERHARDVGVLLSGFGITAFMAFLWVRFGNPLAFTSAQQGWSQHPGLLRNVLKADFFDHLLHDPRPMIGLRLGVQGILGLLFLAAVPAVWRRYGAAIGAYTLVVVALPVLGSAAFESTGRHMLAAFPVFALVGSSLARQSRRTAVGALAVSAATLVVVSSFYARGYFMA